MPAKNCPAPAFQLCKFDLSILEASDDLPQLVKMLTDSIPVAGLLGLL